MQNTEPSYKHQDCDHTGAREWWNTVNTNGAINKQDSQAFSGNCNATSKCSDQP